MLRHTIGEDQTECLMPKPAKSQSLTTVAFVLTSTLTAGMVIGGCNPSNEYQAPPPPTVTVSQPIQQDVTEYREFTGTTEAVETVEVRARVEGYLQSIHFEPTADVKKGDLLFIIDPRPFKVQVYKAQADLRRKQAMLELAKENYQRTKTLYEQKAAPRADFIKDKAARDTAQANLEAARALLQDAKLNLSYTHIRAPITGRVGRDLVKVGNLVGAGENTHLTTVVQYDPIHAYFSLNERDLLPFIERERNKQGKKVENPEDEDVIHLGRANDSGYPFEGRVDFFDQGIDPSTGTFLLRGRFPNPAPHAILPGMFVRIRGPIDQQKGALLVTERALGADQRGRYVLVINEENIVEYRPVEVGATINQMRVIRKGLQVDDWVVVKGLLRARPGAPVSPERVEMLSLLSSDTPPSP
jgi:RND family efflux transporter MFP subunit